MNIIERISTDRIKVYYTLEWGRGAGKRIATGVFTYIKPKNLIQRNHNKEALALLEIKKSQVYLERQAVGSGFVPQHKFKSNWTIIKTLWKRISERGTGIFKGVLPISRLL